MNNIEPYARSFPGQYHNKADSPSWAQVDSYFGWVISNKNNPEINPQGFRDTKDFAKIDHYSGKTRVMILGDSFMLGTGVSAGENVPSFLQTMLNNQYEVFNLSVGAWGIDQMYLAYQKYKDVIRPHIVILAFIDDDVDRVLQAYRVLEGMNKPSFDIIDGKLVLRASTSRNHRLVNAIMSEVVSFGLFMRQVYLMRDARPIVEHIFLQIAQETQRKNQKFVVVRIPTKEDANPITRLIRSLYSFKGTLKRIDVQYLEPLEEMTESPNWTTKFYLSNDGHMSVTGNKYLADYIYKRSFRSRSRAVVGSGGEYEQTPVWSSLA